MKRKSSLFCNALAAACCLGMICPANAAVEPFGVDMYVKSSDFGHYIFRGTRSVATHYPEAGWSIGAMKDGAICFTIADGKSRSYVKWPAIDTTWREGDWNHVAGSFRNGELTLWVNGEKRTNNVHFVNCFKTNVCCVASIASSRAVVTNGCDAMTGGRFKGQVVDYRYFNHALDDAEVSARAAKVAEMRAADPDAPKMVPDELGIDVEPPCALPNTPLTIQPAPQKADLSDKNAALEEPFVIVIPTEDGFAKTAGELFQEALAQGLAMTAKVVRADAELPADGTRFTFEVDETLGKEAYRIKGAVEQGRCRVKMYASDRGFFYAADTMRQLIRIRSMENGRRLSLPERFRIEDWPLMPNRVSIGSWWIVTPRSQSALALSRINGLWLNTLKKDKPVSLEKLREICKMSDSFGVDVVSGFGYLWLGDSRWTFANPESMAAYKAQIDKLGQAGVKGLMFMFDDIQGTDAERMWSGNAEMRKRFRSQGAFQNALVHQGFDWAEAYPNLGAAFKSACPTYYFNGYRELRKAYLADFTKGFRERGVLMHHCAIHPEDIAAVEADGAETYCYYLNGLWPQSRFFTWYTGPESFRWSWYTWHVDLNGRGPVVNPEAMEAVRALHKRTQLFWCASNTGIANMQAGIISWNPAAYDPGLCDRATAQAFFGTGAYEQMRVIESALMPIIGYLGAYRTPNSNEFGVKVVSRRVGLSRKELAGYRRNYEIAEKAYFALERAFADQKTAFDRPYNQDQRRHALAELRKTLDIVRKRLPAPID